MVAAEKIDGSDVKVLSNFVLVSHLVLDMLVRERVDFSLTSDNAMLKREALPLQDFTSELPRVFQFVVLGRR